MPRRRTDSAPSPEVTSAPAPKRRRAAAKPAEPVAATEVALPRMLACLEALTEEVARLRQEVSRVKRTEAESPDAIANEIAFALANPEDVPVDLGPPEPEADFDLPEADLEGKYADLLADIDSFNERLDEAGPIGNDEAQALLGRLATLAEGLPDDPARDGHRVLSEDEIQAMVAEAQAPSQALALAPEEVTELLTVATGDADVNTGLVEADAPLSNEEIEALLAAASAEPGVESAVAESAVEEDPNAMMSNDEIAALLAAASAEPVANSAVAESPVEEDPNAMMSNDEIAALLAAAIAEPVANSPVAESPMEEDPNAMMSNDEIAALLAAASAESTTPSEPEPAPARGGVLSAAQLTALLMAPDVPADPEPLPDPDTVGTPMDADALAALLAEAQSTPAASASGQAPSWGKSFISADPGSTAEAATVDAGESSNNGPVFTDDKRDVGAVRLVPARLAIRAMAVPLGFQEGKLVLRVAEPADTAAIDRISKATGLGIITQSAPMGQVVQELRLAYADANHDMARHVVMATAEERPRLWDRLAGMWKKSA
jgi:hypothetical protein